MASADGSILISTKVDEKGINTGLNSISKSLGKLAGIVGVAFGVGAIVKFGKEAVNMASDLQEVQNVVDTAFGAMSYKMEQFADTAIESFGISELTAKKTGSTFMAMGVGMGIAQDSASDMAIQLTGLSADMASFYNVSQDVASTALKSIFTGETESLKQFGVVMTEVNLQEFARQQGINKTISAMTQQEKVMLRNQFVQQQLSLASGDFAKTSNSWANQTRILSERWKEFLGIVGTGLITVLTPVVRFLNGFVATLITFANTVGSIMSNIFGIQVAEVGATATAYDSMADSATSASEAQQSVADSTEKAGESAKGALAPIDKLNVLQEDSGSGSGGTSGASGGSVVPTTEVSQTDGAIQKATEQTSKWVEEFTRLKKLFTSGFELGFGDSATKIEDVKEKLGSIKTSLIDIFTDKDVVNGAKKYFDSFVLNMGKVSGSIASIGISIAQNLVGGIALYLEQNTPQIKQFLVDMFNIQADVLNTLGNLTQSIAYIFGAIGTQAGQQLTANFIGIISSLFIGVYTIVATIGADIFKALSQPFIDGKENLRQTFETIIQNISDGLGILKGVVDSVFSTIKELYITYIQPVIQSFGDMFSELVNTKLAPLFADLSELFKSIAELVKTLWENKINPTIQKIAPVFTTVFSAIGRIVLTTIGTMTDLIDGLVTTLDGIITFLNGVFSGDWKKAWEGIKKIFKGIWDSLVAVVKAPVNLIIDVINGLIDGVVGGINTVINSLKKLKIDVPDWVTDMTGVGDLGFGNLSTIKATHIPQLANGAVIPPNNKFMAILGDQKSGTNIEAPLDTIVQAFKTAISGMNTQSGDTILMLDGKEIARAVKNQDTITYNRTGQGLFSH